RPSWFGRASRWRCYTGAALSRCGSRAQQPAQARWANACWCAWTRIGAWRGWSSDRPSSNSNRMSAGDDMTRRYTLPFALLGLFVAAPLHGQDAPTPQPAASAESTQVAAARPRRQSWTSSRRSFVEGDVLTVLVDEHTLAAALKGANNSDRRFRDLGVSVGGGPGMPIPDIDAGISSTNSAESRQRGDLTRENRFRGEMSVRIVEIDARTGLMRIEGSKVVAV